MNRAELVEILASKNDLSKAAANAVLETLIDTIQTAVKKGDAVQLVGFGTFKSAKRAARTGKNPSTGAALKIPASTVPKFVAGAKVKAVVDPQAAKRKADKAGEEVPLVRSPPEQTAMGLGLWRFLFFEGAKKECKTRCAPAPKCALSGQSYHRAYEYIF